MSEDLSKLVDKKFIDRLTLIDNILIKGFSAIDARLVQSLQKQTEVYTALLQQTGLTAEDIRQILNPENFYFSYPQDASTYEITGAGELVINYLTGDIKLPHEGSSNLSDNLQNHPGIDHIRSFMIQNDRTIIIRLDNNDAFLVPPSRQPTQFYRQKFTRLSIKTTADTYIYTVASTDPEGMAAIQASPITEGRGYNRNQTLATGSTTLATAYANADSHEVQAYLKRMATDGYILNKDTIESLYLWMSVDGSTFYDSDIGLDVDYTEILPGTQWGLSPRQAHTIKIGASANGVRYIISLS